MTIQPNMINQRKILKNGNIWRWISMFKGKFELCDVVVGEHGAIEEVVSAGEDNSLIGDVVDMKGTYILPGLTDSHLHVDFTGGLSSFALLHGSTSVDDIINKLKETPRQSNGWIFGIGWKFTNIEKRHHCENQSLAEQYGLSRQVLDKEFSDIPVYLYSACGHAGIINTCGLKRCNLIPLNDDSIRHDSIAKLQPYIKRGYIDVDTSGFLTGIFIDTAAMCLIGPHFFPGDRILSQLEILSSLGLTAVQPCDINASKVYRQLSGSLPLRVFHTPWFEDICTTAVQFDKSLEGTEWEETLQKTYARLEHEGLNGPLSQALQSELNVTTEAKITDRLVTNRVKVFADGTIGNNTAALNHSYRDSETSPVKVDTGAVCCNHGEHFAKNPECYGKLCWNEDELRLRFRTAKILGLRVEVHSIGDRAAEKVLDCLKDVGMVGPRWTPVLTHCSILSEKAIQDMKESSVIANIQPSFVPMDTLAANQMLPHEILPYMNIWKTLLRKHEIICAGGSDAPICDADPFIGIYDAMFRPSSTESRQRHKGSRDVPQCNYHPEECLTFSEALFLYTLGAAMASSSISDLFQDESWKKGSRHSLNGTPTQLKLGAIEPGFAADLTVVNSDVSVDSHYNLLQTQVLSTWVAGVQRRL